MFRRVTCQKAASAAKQASRGLATVSPVNPSARHHKVVVVGGGSAGLCVSHQLLHSGKFKEGDIAIIDPAEWHHYQPGWTLVGGGLKKKEELRKPLKGLIDPKFKFYGDRVGSFFPEDNYLTLGNGDKIGYQELIVVPGINVDVSSIKGLPEALTDAHAPVSTIYRYEYCDKAASTVQAFNKGQAIFTQPAGIVKCAGAPQKIMWLSWDHWSRAGLYKPNDSSSPIRIAFATGLPAMFGVPKYSKALDNLRIQRGIEGLFQHDLVSISGNEATFARPDGQESVTRKFDFLHAVPKMGPHAFVKNSALADAAGYVDVDQATFRHKRFANVWSIGDASSLPTSKTAAAITAQSPILVRNILTTLESQPLSNEGYDGYTSCPLTTGSKQVLLAEFKYGGVPKETFNSMFGIDQGVPRRAFYHLKKDFFPWVYGKYMVKGKWGGPKGWIR